MDINVARTFLEVVKTGSFVNAAANLNLTQTAVSARIRVLEEQLAGRRQPRTGLVADKHLAVELLLEHPNSRADRSLRQVEVGGCVDETAGFHDLEEGPCDIDVHVIPSGLRVHFKICQPE